MGKAERAQLQFSGLKVFLARSRRTKSCNRCGLCPLPILLAETMHPNFRFAIASDLHIALPQTVNTRVNRFHLCEISIPILETVLAQLAALDLDFLLLPGDLTQDGERINHRWLADRLAQLPYPVFVVPGNHDVIQSVASDVAIGLHDFQTYYGPFGYDNPNQLYYTCELLPGVQLIGLNSNQFDQAGKQQGYLDAQQLCWLDDVLAESRDRLVLVMVHHNAIEHLPGQTTHCLGKRYMLDNAPELLSRLQAAGVQLIFTGHLHVQDVACHQGIYEITTGSLVSYPHPYRLLHYRSDSQGRAWLQIESSRVESVPGWPDLSSRSRQWLCDRSLPFMFKLLNEAPLNLPPPEATTLAPQLREFWADIAQGDTLFNFDQFPGQVRRYLESFSACDRDNHPTLIDNHVSLLLQE